MKKVLYLALAIVIIIILYFWYESYCFKYYIENQNQKNNMNIPINETAPVKSKNQIEIAASIDTVWKILTEINDWPKWQKSVTEVIVNSKIKEGSQFNWKAGGLSFKSKIHTSIPKSEFGWTGTTI